MKQKHLQKNSRIFFYIKVPIKYLNTFNLGCGLSLVIDRPDRPVAVLYESIYKLLKYFHSWLWIESGHGQTRSARGRYRIGASGESHAL